MRDMLIVLVACIAAILVGAGLYYYGPDEFREIPVVESTSGENPAEAIEVAEVAFAVIGEGTTAVDAPERKNIAVYGEEEFARIWSMAYGTDAPPRPSIDFDTQYVIGVFSGTRATGGHAVSVTSVIDGSKRTVAVELTAPVSGCLVSQALTSPFELISVPSTELELESVERLVETPC